MTYFAFLGPNESFRHPSLEVEQILPKEAATYASPMIRERKVVRFLALLGVYALNRSHLGTSTKRFHSVVTLWQCFATSILPIQYCARGGGCHEKTAQV
jgi:hypothetical protein